MILAGTGTGSRGSWRAMPPCHFTCLMRFCRPRRGLQGSVRWAGRAHHLFFSLPRCDVGFSAFAGFAGFLLLCRGVAIDLLSSSAARGPVQSPRLCRLLRRCRRSPFSPSSLVSRRPPHLLYRRRHGHAVARKPGGSRRGCGCATQEESTVGCTTRVMLAAVVRTRVRLDACRGLCHTAGVSFVPRLRERRARDGRSPTDRLAGKLTEA